MTLREKAEAAASSYAECGEDYWRTINGGAPCVQCAGYVSGIADAIEQVAREFAEAAVRRYALFRQTTYEDTQEQLIVSALKDTEKRIK